MRGVCPNCQKEFANLGSHMRFCKVRLINKEIDEYPDLVVDKIAEKPLSSMIAEIENILKAAQHSLEIIVTKQNGTVSDVELKARFQIRR